MRVTVLCSVLGSSQWSLTFEVRKRVRMLRSVIVMDYQSQWSLTFEVRKRLLFGVSRQS